LPFISASPIVACKEIYNISCREKAFSHTFLPFVNTRSRSFALNNTAMRHLLCFLLLGVAACAKNRDDVMHEKPVAKKIEWHVHASGHHNEPWLDAMQAQVQIRLYKIDTLNKTTQTLWDTTFASRTLRNYPGLPQKLLVEKQVLHLKREKLQVWYNIRYEMNGNASEMGRMDQAQKPFTFIDVKL
jgi:hypothetical protein